MTDPAQIAALIDHTQLKPDASRLQIGQLCAEAKQYGFASVCVNGAYVPLAANVVQGSSVNVCATVGFPLGAMATAAKVAEARIAIEQGAREVDMVLHIGALKDEDNDAVQRDIAAVVAESHAHGVICKVILETVFLNDEHKVIACRLAKDAGADFVKTSTGFSGGGATVHDIRLMRSTVGPEMGVKASGGVRTLADAEAMIEAGATRIGASAGVSIMQEALGEGGSAAGDGY